MDAFRLTVLAFTVSWLVGFAVEVMMRGGLH
ncbi:MAG: hypothetical protein JWS11_2082 [Cypionkella sp.]|nr:hypothetical protein [Cypionkella sp.]